MGAASGGFFPSPFMRKEQGLIVDVSESLGDEGYTLVSFNRPNGLPIELRVKLDQENITYLRRKTPLKKAIYHVAYNNSNENRENKIENASLEFEKGLLGLLGTTILDVSLDSAYIPRDHPGLRVQ